MIMLHWDGAVLVLLTFGSTCWAANLVAKLIRQRELGGCRQKELREVLGGAPAGFQLAMLRPSYSSIFSANNKYFQCKRQAFSIFFQYIFNAQTPVFECNNRTDSGSHRYSVRTASLSAAGQQGLTGNHWFTPNFSCTPLSLLWHSTFIDTRLLFHHCIHKVSVGKLPKRMEGKGLTQSRFFLIELKFM